MNRAHIRAAYLNACEREIDALKPGNVHRFADGHGMEVAHFLTSASVSSGPLTDPALPLGRRILEAVRATRTAVGMNTNLGILLLCAPIAVAAESGTAQLRATIGKALDSITMDDTADIFEAIASANPGGLGNGGENDVRKPPKIALMEAMREAADRDRIAYQYISGYQDIFELGVPALKAASSEGMWPTINAYLTFLSSFPDSHVARKQGLEIAKSVQHEAREIQSSLKATDQKNLQHDLLLAFDERLKNRGINPGTSADLTVASLFVQRLTDRLA
ncbi:MAG: triphosphoribosyl-dephospho-CoA synthase [Mesorhizobium sp.]